MEIIGYFNDAEIMIHSDNGIINYVYIWKDDEHLFKSLFYEGFNSLFHHACEPIEFIKEISSKLWIAFDENDDMCLYNIECRKLEETIKLL